MKSSLTQRPVVILISGRGSNMRSLIEQSREPGAPYTVCRVFSDKPDAAGLEVARDLGVSAQALPAAKTTDRAVYDRALAAAIHGATVHFVTERLDGGPPVIQARIAVTANDDEASLAARVQAQEHRIYPVAVRWFCEGRLRYDAGCAWLDGRLLREPVQFTGAER